MNKRSIEDIYALLNRGHSARYVQFLGFDAKLIANARSGGFNILHRVERGDTRQQLLTEGFQPSAIDFAIEQSAKLKLAGKSKPPAKPKRRRTTRDLVRFGNRGINVLKRR